MKGIRRLILSGRLPRRNLPWEEAKEQFEIAEDRYEFPAGGDPSPYLERAVEGATIHPRAAWFVRIVKAKGGIVDVKLPYVETDTTIEHKKPWHDVHLDGEIEARFLFGTALGVDVLPFVVERVRPVVLPLLLDKHGGAGLVTRDRALGEGCPELAVWLGKAAKAWAARKKKGSKMTIYERLDFHHLLRKQRPHRESRVIFNASGTYMTAAVLSKEDVAAEIEAVPLNGFIVDNKFYVLNADTEDEAHYLAAALNSPAIDKYIKPYQTMGLFGERDIHRRALEYVPMPEYDGSIMVHRRLAELGRSARTRVLKMVPSLTKTKIGQRRAAAREAIKDILKEIDALVIKVTGINTGKRSNAKKILKGQTKLEFE